MIRNNRLEVAFNQAGIPTETLDKIVDDWEWVRIEKMPEICKALGTQWLTNGTFHFEENEPLIAIYVTDLARETNHAVFVPDLGPLIERGVKFCGFIRVREINDNKL